MTLLWLFWQIFISFCKFLMARPLKWSILGAHKMILCIRCYIMVTSIRYYIYCYRHSSSIQLLWLQVSFSHGLIFSLVWFFIRFVGFSKVEKSNVNHQFKEFKKHCQWHAKRQRKGTTQIRKQLISLKIERVTFSSRKKSQNRFQIRTLINFIKWSYLHDLKKVQVNRSLGDISNLRAQWGQILHKVAFFFINLQF